MKKLLSLLVILFVSTTLLAQGRETELKSNKNYQQFMKLYEEAGTNSTKGLREFVKGKMGAEATAKNNKYVKTIKLLIADKNVDAGFKEKALYVLYGEDYQKHMNEIPKR